MLDHHHAASASSDDKLPNQHFFTWLKDRTALFVSQLLALLGFIYVPTSTLYYAAHFGNEGHLEKLNPYVQLIVDGAHIAVLTLFVVVLLGIRYSNKEGAYRTLRTYESVFNATPDEKKVKLLVKQGRLQLRRFKHYFLWFWIAMLALYISFTFEHGFKLPKSTHAAEASAGVATPSLPGLSSSVSTPEASGLPADHPTTPSPDRSVARDARTALGILFFPFLTFALNNLSLMFIFWCFLTLYLPTYDSRSNVRHRLHVGFSSFFVAMLTLSYPLLLIFVYHGDFTSATLVNYATVFNGISGVCNAVVLALLIARLDSKLIGLPSSLISLLYFYSAVQPLFAVFEQSGEAFKIIQTSVLIIVFGFKIYFFLIIVYALQTGRMLNYLICFPQLERRINSIWDNQLEARAAQGNDNWFHLSVTKKKKKAYTSYNHFKTIEDCDVENAELRKVMRRRSSYHIGNQTGTFWVDVFDFRGQKLFYSVALKSEDEAKDLIEESMDKIGYCKYDRS